MPYGDGLAFPGDQLLRLSMDLATGTAGVLFAMSTALHERPVFLPLPSRPAAQAPCPWHCLCTDPPSGFAPTTHQRRCNHMVLLDLQSLEAPGGGHGGGGGGGGSTLTILGCQSVKPSNLSLLLCH